MPTRLIHESLCTSESIARCSPRAQDAFPRFVLYADNHGVFQINTAVIKGRLWSLRKDVRRQDVEAWFAEYEREGMIHTWEQDGKRFGHFANWPRFQRTDPRLSRKWPVPPCCAAGSPEPPKGSGNSAESPGNSGNSAELPGKTRSHSQSQSQEQYQGQSQSHGRDNGDFLTSKGRDGPDWTTMATLTRRLKHLNPAQAGKVLTAFVSGFGQEPPSAELLANEFSRLVNKINRARNVRSPCAYAMKAVEMFHQERVPYNPKGVSDGSSERVRNG